MIIIAAVDDGNGMLFNNRRQSQDRVLRETVLAMTAGSRLWMNHYTEKQFKDANAPHINVDDRFLSEAAPGEYCFVENVSVAPYEAYVEKIILFKWNRSYPGDFHFDIDVAQPDWQMVSTEDFQGSSHEKITMEVYTK